MEQKQSYDLQHGENANEHYSYSSYPINDRAEEFKLTRSQAEALYNTLGQALGKTTGALNRHTGVTECQPTTPRWFDNEFVY